MTDEAHDATGDPSVEAEPASDPVESPPSWFASFADEMRGKIGELGKDQGRLRSALKKAQTGSESSSPAAVIAPSKPQAASGDPMNDYRAQRDLMRLEANLSEEKIAWLDEHSEGLSLRERALLVNAMSHGATVNAKKPTPQRSTTTRAANAAERTSANHPRSQAELSALARDAFGTNGVQPDEAAKRRWDALKRDPTFTADFS